ncbi:MAG TPA: pseudouridine synthase [Candidatus Saccharimonadales bacterium]|nr:pseudouridine synthase [Candidatus Saccharimonadales bacterium]
MRINKIVAAATGMSRRAADQAIQQGRVLINSRPAKLGDEASPNDQVTLDGQSLTLPAQTTTIMLNKPVGYVCSRQGQGSRTIYELLPSEYQSLKPVGRLDKDSSGLILLTNDGQLAQELTHPKYAKTKIYEISLDKSLEPLHQQMISDYGVQLEDGSSKLALEKLNDFGHDWRVTMHEGRNRQIRRTFAALGYNVINLHRTALGPYRVGDLSPGDTIPVLIQ